MADSDWVDDDHGDWVDDQPHENKFNAAQSGGMHAINQLTGGFSDELQGLGEAAGRVVGIKGAGGPMKDMGVDAPTLDWETLRDAYKAARDRERATLKQQSAEHPAASAIGDVTGMIASPLNKLAGGMSLAGGGAALGGVNALGSSESEDLGGMAKDTAIGTGLGLGLGAIAQKASPLIEKGIQGASAGARELAERFGARALGAERGTIKSLGIDKVKGAAAQMLDNGGFSPLATTDDLMARNAALKAKGGGMMDDVYKTIDDAGASTFHPHDAAEAVESELGNVWRTPINRGETSQLDNTIESILERGSGDIPLSEAQILKEELGGAANWQNKLTVTPKEQMARDAYGIVNRQIDEAAELGANAVGQSGLPERLAEGKGIYSKAKTADTLLQNKQAREQGNSLIGLTDAITGAGALGYGATTDDWKTAGGIMLAKKGLQKYGAQNAALGLNKISQALARSPQMAEMLASKPQVFSALAQKMEGMVGGGLGRAAENKPKPYDKEAILQKAQGTKFNQALQSAAQRGDQAFNATYFVLQNNPEFREAAKRKDDEAEQ